MKLLKTLRSNEFAIVVAILSMILQSFHTFTAFRNTSNVPGIAGILEAVLAAIVVDLAILFYTVRARKDVATGAAIVMVIINVYFYYVQWGISFTFAFGCFLALVIPISVYFYSEEIKDDDIQPEFENMKDQEGRHIAEIGKLRDESGKWYKESQSWEQQFRIMEKRFHELRLSVNPPVINDDKLNEQLQKDMVAVSGKIEIPRSHSSNKME